MKKYILYIACLLSILWASSCSSGESNNKNKDELANDSTENMRKDSSIFSSSTDSNSSKLLVEMLVEKGNFKIAKSNN